MTLSPTGPGQVLMNEEYEQDALREGLSFTSTHAGSGAKKNHNCHFFPTAVLEAISPAIVLKSKRTTRHFIVLSFGVL